MSPTVLGWYQAELHRVALTTYHELRPGPPTKTLVPPLALSKEFVMNAASTKPLYRLFVGVDIAAATASVAWMTPGTKVTRSLHH